MAKNRLSIVTFCKNSNNAATCRHRKSIGIVGCHECPGISTEKPRLNAKEKSQGRKK